jgi:hypothetical protein
MSWSFDLAERDLGGLGDRTGGEVGVAVGKETLAGGGQDRGARLGRRPIATFRAGTGCVRGPIHHPLSIRSTAHEAIE